MFLKIPPPCFKNKIGKLNHSKRIVRGNSAGISSFRIFSLGTEIITISIDHFPLFVPLYLNPETIVPKTVKKKFQVVKNKQ